MILRTFSINKTDIITSSRHKKPKLGIIFFTNLKCCKVSPIVHDGSINVPK